MRPRVFWLFVLFGMLWLSRCTSIEPPRDQLLNVLDFAPKEAEVGDRLEVIGSGLPEGRAARVVFRGTLYRPGQKPVTDAVIEVDAASSSSERIELMLTEGLSEAFCGAGDSATHTTFEGDVVASFASSKTDGLPVRGTVRGVRLDLRPPTPRRAVVEALEGAGQRALDFLGVGLATESPTTGGLLVGTVRSASPAERAGIVAGDLIVAFDGVRVLSKVDVAPTGAQRSAAITTVRLGPTAAATGSVGAAAAAAGPSLVPGAPHARAASPVPIAGQERVHQVSLEGFRPGLPADFLSAGLVLLTAAVIVLVFMAPTAGIITWFERRVSARIQSRIGPNRAGPQGFLIWVADGIKSILKEDIIPAQTDKPLFRLAPYLVFIGVSATFCVMPFGQHFMAADLDIGILFVIAVTSLVTIGLMTGGWASNNKWSLLGGIRSAAQIISYEIPSAIAIVCIVMMTGSLRLSDIVRAQEGVPWRWFMFENPVTVVLFFLWFTTALAEGNRTPFDLPEAESELVAGYSTEYSGMRYVFLFFAEWANVFVMCGIGSALFLGGWQIPGISAAEQSASFWLQCAGAVVFQLKAWVLIFVVVWIRWTLPRIRIDQLMNLCWKWLVPASFVALGFTALWLVWSPLPIVQSIISKGVFGLWIVFVGYFFWRVAYNLRAANAQVHLNPLL